MDRAMAVRGAGRRRSRELPVLSSAASQVHPAARGSRPVAVGAVSDQQGKFTRKAIRDLTGQTFVKQRLPLFLSLFKRGSGDDEISHESFVSSGADKMARFLWVNAVLFGLFWLAGAGVWYFGVWVVAMATWLPLVTRIRNIAEHASTSTGPEPFSQARTTLANPIERALIAPYWVNYHAEHHFFMYLPCYRLPEAHRLLSEKGLIKRVTVSRGYRDVLRLATSARGA